MRAADRPLLKEEKVPGVVPVGRFGSTARALKRPVSTPVQPPLIQAVDASTQCRFFARYVRRAWLPGLLRITYAELSPIDKKSLCFPLEQRRGTRERYIHKCRRDLPIVLCVRDLRFFPSSLSSPAANV